MPARGVAQSQNVQFLRASIRRILEPSVEARTIRIGRHRRSDVTQTCLPVVLACLCRLAVISRTRVSDLKYLSPASDYCVFDSSLGGAGFPRIQPPRVWALSCWFGRGGWCARKVCVGIQSNDLRCNWSPGWGFLLECVAPPRNSQWDHARCGLTASKLSNLNSKRI